mmetsp:Transcript_1405/g.4112  ORF Transcript_1405/g.4112 Transcript_1405/m.4112 type:complete len:179 (+) Transcript_1405:107-643(+)
MKPSNFGHIIWGELELSDLDGDDGPSGDETGSSTDERWLELMETIRAEVQFRASEASSSSDDEGPTARQAQASVGGSMYDARRNCVRPAGVGALDRAAGSRSREDVASTDSLSARHDAGECSPCAFYWRLRGCSKGTQCDFCHYCPQGAFIAKRKEKIARLKAEGRTRRGGGRNNDRL